MKYSKEVTVGIVSVAAATVGSSAAYAQDWTGPYAGASVGFASGQFPFATDDDYTMTGATANLFAGYNWSTSGNIIIGGELAFQIWAPNGDADGLADEPDDYLMSSMIDAKLKAGMGFGNVLAYGFVGASVGTTEAYEDEYSYVNSGLNYGLGAEMMVTPTMSVGVEHIMRSLYSPYDEEYATSATTSLRVAFRF